MKQIYKCLQYHINLAEIAIITSVQIPYDGATPEFKIILKTGHTETVTQPYSSADFFSTQDALLVAWTQYNLEVIK